MDRLNDESACAVAGVWPTGGWPFDGNTVSPMLSLFILFYFLSPNLRKWIDILVICFGQCVHRLSFFLWRFFRGGGSSSALWESLWR